MNFSYKKFIEELNNGDLCGLEYLEKKLIENMKDKNKNNNTDDFTREEYITSLFYAVKELNNCNFIYECTSVKNSFDYDIYYNARDLLVKEIKNYIVENGVFSFE